jgi:hypothetical protein
VRKEPGANTFATCGANIGDHSICNFGDKFHIVSCQDDRMTGISKVTQDCCEAVFCRVVQAAGRLVEQQ